MIELRRRKPDVPIGTRVWIYTTVPVARVEGYATLSETITLPKAEFWSLYKTEAGVSQDDFDRYFDGLADANGLRLVNIQKLTSSISLDGLRREANGFHPPQFFRRLTVGEPELELLLSAV